MRNIENKIFLTKFENRLMTFVWKLGMYFFHYANSLDLLEIQFLHGQKLSYGFVKKVSVKNLE